MGVRDYLTPTSHRITCGHVVAVLSVMVFFGILVGRSEEQLSNGQELQKIGDATVDVAWAVAFVSLIPAYIFLVVFSDKLLRFMKVVEGATLVSRPYALYLTAMPVLCFGAFVGKTVGLKPFSSCEWWAIFTWPGVYLITLSFSFDRLYLSDITSRERRTWRCGLYAVVGLLEMTFVGLSVKLDRVQGFETWSWAAALAPVLLLDLLLLLASIRASLSVASHLLEHLSHTAKRRQNAADVLFSKRGVKYMQLIFYWPIITGFFVYFCLQVFASVDGSFLGMPAVDSTIFLFLSLFIVLILCCRLPWILSDTVHLVDNSHEFSLHSHDESAESGNEMV